MLLEVALKLISKSTAETLPKYNCFDSCSLQSFTGYIETDVLKSAGGGKNSEVFRA